MENHTATTHLFHSFDIDPRGKHPSFVYADHAKSGKNSYKYLATLKELQRVASKYSPEQIYMDFVQIYDATGSDPKPEILGLIAKISESYGSDAESINYLFTIHYHAMLSEQHASDSRLGKRIRRLAVHQALFDKDGESIPYSPPRKWWLLDAQCRQLGF